MPNVARLVQRLIYGALGIHLPRGLLVPGVAALAGGVALGLVVSRRPAQPRASGQAQQPQTA